MSHENPSIVVLGGGYAGVVFARTLARELQDPSEILVLDRLPHHQLVVQLHQAAVFGWDPKCLAVPFSRISNGWQYRQADIQAIDLYRREVMTDRGVVSFRWLVIALGSEAQRGIPGAEQAFKLRSLDDANRLRSHLASIGKHLGAAGPGNSEPWSTIAICGGGSTGVQLAGEIADWLNRGDGPAGCRVILLEAANRLLPNHGERLGVAALKALERRSVSVRHGHPVIRVDGGQVCFANGTKIASHSVILAVGLRLPALVAEGELATTNDGVATDEFLRVVNHPEVMVAGDCLARIGDGFSRVPLSAQAAVQTGEAAALNLARTLARRPLKPFRFRDEGEAISVGRHDAVARIGPTLVAGFAAAAMKRFAEERYVERIGGMTLLRKWEVGQRRRLDAGTAPAIGSF